MPDQNVYIGAWQEWKHGQYLGATLTLPAFYTYFIISAVTMLVDVIGGQIWRILSFCLHHFRSTSEPSDGLHFQTQTVLRNNYTGSSMLRRLIRLTWAWRKRTAGAFRRTMPLIIIAGIHLALFVALGLLASQITETSSKVRVKSDVCGWVDQSVLTPAPDAAINLGAGDALAVSTLSIFRKSVAYGTQCYANDGSQAQGQVCQFLIQERLSSKINDGDACPFAAETCSAKAYSLDTGLVDASTHLGMNIPMDTSIQFRKVTTCAPLLVEEQFSTPFQAERKPPVVYNEAQLPGDMYKYYTFGKLKMNRVVVADWAWEMQNYTVVTGSSPYQLFPVSTYVDNNSSGQEEDEFEPVADFRRDDADITMLGLLSRVSYTGESKDPWFLAPQKSNNMGSAPVWKSQRILSFLGCTEQYQICNGESHCTPLSGIWTFLNSSAIASLDLNERQEAVFNFLWKLMWFSKFRFTLGILGTEMLLATRQLFGTQSFISSPLTPNHWQKEVQNLHNTSLAAMQLMAVEHANPTNHQIRENDSSRNHVIKETTPNNKFLCKNQIIRSTAYSSFKIFHIVIIIGAGCVFSIVANTLPSCIAWYRKRTQKGQESNKDWHQNDTLQIQRRTFEAAGVGPWLNKEAGIPVTETYGQKFIMSYFESEDTQSKHFYQVLEHGSQSTGLKASAYASAQPVQQNGYVPVAGTSYHDGEARGTPYQTGWQQLPQQPGYAY